MPISKEGVLWIENRLCGIGSHLRKEGLTTNTERKELVFKLGAFMDMVGVNKYHVWSRFFDKDNGERVIKVPRSKDI